MSRLALLQSELRQNVENLNEVEEMLAMAPDYQDALDMKAEIVSKRKELEQEIATIQPSAPPAATHTAASPPSPPPTEKWSRENHPAYRKNTPLTPAPAVEEQKTFSVNDTVSAKYAGDKGFYPAQIISITGSSSAPIYTVKFKGYSGTETVRAHEIRAIPSSTSGAQKRKADGSPVVPTTPSTPVNAPMPNANPGVISAAPNINPELASAMKKEPSKISDGPARPDKAPKKVKTTKALEGAKNNWQSWQQKAGSGKVAKAAGKESMFRTGESATARVGFTGSGSTMRKDPQRSRHIYQLDEN